MATQDQLVQDMLKNIPDPQMREQYGRIVNGTTVHRVRCMSEDRSEDREFTLTDDDSNPVYYKSGPRKGEAKTETRKVLVHKGCKGRVIATIDDTGMVREQPPVPDKEGINGIYSSGLEGSRLRFDGEMGFRCYCGNNSILCEEEKGIITPAPPSEADLRTIALRLSKRSNIQLPEVGKRTIYGFIIEDL